MISEFKEFAVKGNVVDVAVGVIIGGAFGKIVSSVVEDIIMPPISLVVGKVDFTNLYLPLNAKAKVAVAAARDKGLALGDARKAGAVWAYGNFLNNLVTFAIVALVVFMMVTAINHLKREPAPASPAAPLEPTAEEKLITEIRDLLKM